MIDIYQNSRAKKQKNKVKKVLYEHDNKVDTIKELLKNDKLYTDNEVLFPPMFDGSAHKILLSGNRTKEIECFNLWYWINYKRLNSVRNTSNKEDYEIIDAIQNILNDNDINYYILKDGE